MNTESSAEQLEIHGLGRRAVVGKFDGGKISADSGGLWLRDVEQRMPGLKRLTGCFTDHREAEWIAQSLESLVKQRVMGLALGDEDLHDPAPGAMLHYGHCSVTSRTYPARHVNETRTQVMP